MVHGHVGHAGIGVIVVLEQAFSARVISRELLEIHLAELRHSLGHCVPHPGKSSRQQRSERIR